MNKNIFAFVALLAVASAAPYGQSYAPASYAPAPSVVYQQVPVVVEVAQPKYAPAPASYYPAPAPPATYTGPSVAYNQLPLVASPKYGSVSYAAPAPYNAPAPYYAPAPVSYKAPAAPLIAAPSNPRATASANANSGSLRPGSYSQLAIPSYNIVSAEPAPEADVGANYRIAPSLLLPNPLPAPAPKAYY